MAEYGGLSGIGPSFSAGAMAGEDLKVRREQARQAQMATQEALDDRASLAALGRAFGVAPPPPPSAPAPAPSGQPSVPPGPPSNILTTGGQPIAPPGTYMNPQASPATARAPSAPPPAGAPRPPPAAPAPPAGGGMPIVPGQMTVQQLAARITAANPGIQTRPDLLMRAVAKGQALLAPDQRAEVAALQLQQKIDAANQKFELGHLAMQNKLDLMNQANAMKLQIEQVKQAGANERTTEKLETAMELLITQIAGKKDVQADKDKAAGERDDKKAGRVDRRALVGMATKAGVQADPAWNDDELQQNTAAAVAKQAGAGGLGDDEAAMLATVFRQTGQVPTLGRGSTKADYEKLYATAVKQIREAGGSFQDIAAAKVAFTGAQQEARTIGGQAGRVDIGTRELDKFAPLVLGASKKVSRTKYPSVNALELAAQRGTGGTDVIQLVDYINGLKNAYAQVLARGGASSVDARKRADEVINANWSQGQLEAGIKALRTEAQKAGEAAREASAGVAKRVAGKPETSGESEPTAAPTGLPAGWSVEEVK